MSGVRLGVDIGGTFTDIALEHPGRLSTVKVLTDHARPERAILAGIAEACGRAGVARGDIVEVIHGTTLVTNALIERQGARLAFVTTEGFRDVIEMRSENRFEQYDLNLVLPEPLVPRKDRFVAVERVGADGGVLLPLAEAEIARLVGELGRGGYEAVAVGFLHAYANPDHERHMRDALLAEFPALSVSISSEVSPQMRELPRFNTVIANAYVQPRVAAYLGRLAEALRGAGVSAPVFMMHSGGGLIGVETAMAQPVRLLESGPAGGAIFAAGYARAHGIERALSFDMGGTTAKICLIEDGTPKTAGSFEIARTYRFKKGSGMVVSTPVVEMVEIGAGGGSVAALDNMGRISVGPRSAGSEPGPACYRQGGTEATVTDANLLLGRLDPEGFAGGAIPLAPELARAALARALGALGCPVTEAACGVVEIVDENMANAARVHAVEHGRDIEGYTMIAFGGGAPLHAARLCRKLGIARLLIPPGAGVGSAIGFLRAPFSYEAARGLFQRLDAFEAETVNAVLGEMREEAEAFVARGAGAVEVSAALTAHMRYAGQGWEIPVRLGPVAALSDDPGPLRAAFTDAYARLFGRTIEGLAVEVTNWSLRVAGPTPPVAPVAPVAPSSAPALASQGKDRLLVDPGARREVRAVEVARADLAPGMAVDGPAVIAEAETSTIVPDGFRAVCETDGVLHLSRREDRP
ncbi:MAG: hydantoinase/oxoprolinase family protein [Paracoccaceae bacterium]|nr:hydantoinase/oxoprolinase family protein [Paracoccaceae bacterium]